jgi:glycine/D-amino acid oxidase-like deaminating enzyme
VGSARSGHGFKFAPAVGERLAALALDDAARAAP